jgi:predicted metal-binding membrane protein
VAALSWAYLWFAPMPMPASSGGLRTAHYLAFTFAMWLVMMIGMMVPSAAPTVLMFDRISRRPPNNGSFARTASFLCGYLIVWGGFSVVATVAQIELISLAVIDDMGVTTGRLGAAALLLAVGIYQWLPAKRACLAHCQSPVDFLVREYRPGYAGALRMGMRHGLYCLGCCWALMLLLFVGGVMNLLWVAVIAALVFAEKVIARGRWLRDLIGAVAVIGAGVLLAGAF